MLREICMEKIIKDSLDVSKQNYFYKFSHFSQCIASQPESNFLKSLAFCESITAVFIRYMIQCNVLNQCTDFGVSPLAMTMAACLSAVNRVKHLYSQNCHLKCHGNSIEQVWLKLNICPPVALILTGTMYSFDLALPAVAVYLAGIFPGVSPVGGACPRLAILFMPN